MKKVLAAIAVILLMPVLMVGCFVTIGGLGSDPASACAPSLSLPASGADNGGSGTAKLLLINGRQITNEQLENASIIIGVARSRKLSARDALLGVMVAIQESHLINVHYGHLDSLGLFQQRSTWGTAAQRTNPIYASNAFFNALVTIKNRKSMSLLDVALAVQRPSRAAYLSPTNYFPGWEPLAKSLLGKSGVSPVGIEAACAADSGVPGKVIVAPGANFPGKPIRKELMDFLALVAGRYGKPIVISTGTNHSYFTVNGNVSDHAVGYGADFSMMANGWPTLNDPAGDKLATAALIEAGDPPAVAARNARIGMIHNRVYKGLRIQVIWRCSGDACGGDHTNHVHIGAKPVNL